MFTELVDGVTLLVFMRLCNITVKVPRRLSYERLIEL